MKEKYFIWLLDSNEPSCGGPKLIHGEVHNVEDYPSHVVPEWIKTKAAKYVKDKPKKEEIE